ncbi:hypothetical protein V5O48_008830 [Marasmius crinis-equi]|uniref:DUF6534 domain-containing protein n=1 Tax=Marasmius crinis-equi TaxID=585013 RepID=A0ABR3FDB0_9AGAR
MFGLVLACAVLNGQIIHFYLLKNFGNFLAATQIAKEVSVLTLLSILVTVIGDLCFASRIWRLRRVHVGIIGLIVLTAIACLVSGAVLINQVLKVPFVTSLASSKDKTAVAIINFMAAASQAISTFALWYSFKAHMDEASNTPQSVLQRLSRGVLFRGGILTLSQLLIAILYLARPDRLWWTPIHQMLAPFYYITTVAMLNKRRVSSVSSASQNTDADLDFPMMSDIKRHDSALSGTRHRSLITDGDPFANHGRPTPFLDLHPSDSRGSGKLANREMDQPLTSADLLTVSTGYPSSTATPSSSNGSGSDSKGKEREKERESHDDPFVIQKIRKLPAVPGAAMLVNR